MTRASGDCYTDANRIFSYIIYDKLVAMAELVDALASGASGRKAMGVRVSLATLLNKN